MNLLSLSFNFEVSLRGGGRLHNPVSRGTEEGKTTEGSTGVLPDDSRYSWDSALALQFRAGSSPERIAERTGPPVSGWRGFKNGGCLRTSAVQANQPAAPATPTGLQGVLGLGLVAGGAAYVERPPFGVKMTQLAGEFIHFAGCLLTNSDCFSPNLTLTGYCDLEVSLDLTWVT